MRRVSLLIVVLLFAALGCPAHDNIDQDCDGFFQWLPGEQAMIPRLAF